MMNLFHKETDKIMSISSDEDEDQVFIPITTWTYPSFVKPFETSRFQQFDDAFFRAVVTGKPVPEVAWSKKGKPLPNSDKYEYSYDANSGQVTLVIRDLGQSRSPTFPTNFVSQYVNIELKEKITSPW